jgi:hypothetical protein
MNRNRAQTKSAAMYGKLFCRWFSLLALLFASGCSNRTESGAAPAPPAEQKPATVNKSVAGPKKSTAKDNRPVETKVEMPVLGDRKESPPHKQPNSAALGDLLKQPADSMGRMMPDYQRIQVDDEKAAAAGIRKIEGKRITLYTDIAGAEIDRLPAIFDLAFPQFCEYFRVKPKTVADWHATGFLMKDKKKFDEAGLIPAGLPNFPHGFSWNYDLWLFDQKSDYYRRHLLLHEGVHSFMNTVLGGCGAPWYMEGMAEMLATHAYRDGRLMLNYFPQSRDEVPELGRIRIIHDDLAANRGLPLEKILAYPPSAHHSNDAYAWSWAAAKLFDTHPRYQQRFRELPKDVLHPDFNADFRKLFADDLPDMYQEWQVFIDSLEYGYDIPRTVIDFTPGRPVADSGEPITVTVAADRGWQNSGLRVEEGRKYELTAVGRWKKTVRPKLWAGLKDPPEQIELEPGGISIRYYRGQPVGLLQAAVRPDAPQPDAGSQNSKTPFSSPIAVGLDAALTPATSGTLYYKLNDSAADLSSNDGEVKVEIQRRD